MIFEVNSIEVAIGIEYVVRHENFHGANLVVFLPKGKWPFPRICYGGEWEESQNLYLEGLEEETLLRYKRVNAIAVVVKSSMIVIIDIVGLKSLELYCPYYDAISYLEYLLYGVGGVDEKHYPFF